jgi:hypothetical protein
VRFTQLGFKVVSGCLTEEGVTRLSSVVTKAVRCDVTKEIDIRSSRLDGMGELFLCCSLASSSDDWISLTIFFSLLSPSQQQQRFSPLLLNERNVIGKGMRTSN